MPSHICKQCFKVSYAVEQDLNPDEDFECVFNRNLIVLFAEFVKKRVKSNLMQKSF